MQSFAQDLDSNVYEDQYEPLKPQEEGQEP